jgi:glycerophosphoryl diester phosphodiesterase
MSFADAVVVIGHRGAAGLEPENTLPSFRRAYACGVSAVELDVYCVENALVVIHDDTLERTTNGYGEVRDQSLTTLRRLNAGNGWPPPLLEEVVAELPRGVGLNIELKGPHTAAPVAALLARHRKLDVLVSSFQHQQLHEFRRLDGSTPVAPLYARWNSGAWQTAEALGAAAINLSRRAVTPQRLIEARQRGLKSFVYTVNDLQEARKFVDWGASGLFTDYPDRITQESLLQGMVRTD